MISPQFGQIAYIVFSSTFLESILPAPAGIIDRIVLSILKIVDRPVTVSSSGPRCPATGRGDDGGCPVLQSGPGCGSAAGPGVQIVPLGVTAGSGAQAARTSSVEMVMNLFMPGPPSSRCPPARIR